MIPRLARVVNARVDKIPMTCVPSSSTTPLKEELGGTRCQPVPGGGEVRMEIEGMEVVGRVVTGDQRGRTIGFPTANVEVLPGTAMPPLGVYAAFADGRAAAVNVGFRPTFYGRAASLLIEVHVLDFDGDLYGREMSITFLQRIRGERRFEDVSALVSQLEHDVDRVRALIDAQKVPTPIPELATV
jgi:riboflavin kinase/FMN adenylyltransferase